MMKPTLAGAAAAALFAFAPTGLPAQNNSVQANVTAPAASTPPSVTPPSAETEVADPVPAPAPDIEPVPEPDASELVVTTNEVPEVALPPVEEPINPYANSYNELDPLMVEEDEGFDDWGLLGLLGLIGLFGLWRGRERVVYVERAETVRPVDQPPLR